MVRRKENLLAAGMLCIVVAIMLNVLGNTHIFLNVVILFFLALAIFFNAKYVVMASLHKKKK
jgi:hypothetical protein